ncbi:hypothetical protein D8B26_005346 [Coccidioides posadasii str. Silveira]|uniref:Predicted protein n=1 Tax=Coccidioides posadasii (strain RMSCC 757 / Silveira) TaxID=443226 RepID=E9D504_COCPS|nr:predicted protein [Coccidioides posadasii str. Silveira]QVM10693.1 hypothetical protein D8B26_005346 [Coccidioides posadasii str. Silveira]
MASGHSKPYYTWEKNYIVELRNQGHSWQAIANLFNEVVDADRHRTEKAIESQWKHIRRRGGDTSGRETGNHSSKPPNEQSTVSGLGISIPSSNRDRRTN